MTASTGLETSFNASSKALAVKALKDSLPAGVTSGIVSGVKQR